MLPHEFVSKMNGFKPELRQFNGTMHLPAKNVVIPVELDWRTEGYVTEVKDQGACGSCWAFSADNKCRYKKENKGADDIGSVLIPSEDEEALLEALATEGPISIAIDASQRSFQLYSGGVYDEKRCSSTELDHGVLLVGYGVDEMSGKKYWLVKNSWGKSWGEKGYIKMVRGKNNQCGVATSASYPRV
ncbi:hypothetical protein RND71_043586 [Anisodus tanguticus]|uniref:Peptidase C1A papain C-terminal domain-containing protein n=1 Tax=Anisodus tanguticus TaxID=243964 RepID=A0AAE1UTZ2_9SOLA|nr:hypothetical protein RND71_043586 [Anisodus tanguticus]